LQQVGDDRKFGDDRRLSIHQLNQIIEFNFVEAMLVFGRSARDDWVTSLCPGDAFIFKRSNGECH
jgi:hypothetical protein